MKTKIYTFILAIIFIVFSFGNILHTFANETKTRYVLTTEKVPWVKCSCYNNSDPAFKAKTNHEAWLAELMNWEAKSCDRNIQPYQKIYICEHGEGLQGFTNVFKGMIRWVLTISLLLGVLAIAALGVAWAVSGSQDTEYKTFIKKWLINLIIGLVILFTFRYILGFIAPWIFR